MLAALVVVDGVDDDDDEEEEYYYNYNYDDDYDFDVDDDGDDGLNSKVCPEIQVNRPPTLLLQNSS